MLLALRIEIAHIYIHFVSACCKVQGSGYNFFAQLELQWVIHSHLFYLVHADNIACYLFIHRWHDSHKPTINFSAFHLHHWKIVLGFSPHYPTTLLHALGNYGNSSLSKYKTCSLYLWHTRCSCDSYFPLFEVLLTVIQDLFASYYLTVLILTSHVVEKVGFTCTPRI